MIRIDTKIGIDQTVAIGECHLEVELSMDKIFEEGCSMIKIIEVILGKAILEECKIIEFKILEVGIEVTLGTLTLEEVEVGIEKDSTQATLGEMREAAVDQDQVQEQSEQIQQILNLEDKTALKILVVYTNEDLIRALYKRL